MKPKKTKSMNTCNMCFKQMEGIIQGHLSASFCVNPECPNYALYQIPMETMEIEPVKKNDKEKKD